MKTFACLIAITFLLCRSSAICHAQQSSTPATLENLLDGPRLPPLPPSNGGVETPRQPVPDLADVEQSRNLIKQAFEDDYKSAADNPEPLIQKLLVAADKSEKNSQKYAMLLEAIEAAIMGGDHSRAIELVDIRASQFQEDGVNARLQLMARILTPKAKTDPDVLRQVYVHAVDTAKQGVAEDNSDGAKAAAAIAISVAKAMQSLGKSKKIPGLAAEGEANLEESREMLATVQKRLSLLRAYQESVDVLATNPQSPEANEVVGRYRCFVIDDWQAGLGNLAKGNAPELKRLAEAELEACAAQPSDVKKILAVANGWWSVAEAVDFAEAKKTKKHAIALYETIAERLSDPLEVAIARKRMASTDVSVANGTKVLIWNGSTRRMWQNVKDSEQVNLVLMNRGRVVLVKKDLVLNRGTEDGVSVVTEVPVPDSMKFDVVRIEITKWAGAGGGLNEVEVISRGRNIALNCPTQGSGAHDGRFPVSRVTDGSKDMESGTWYLRDSTPGWVEIELPKK